LAKKWLLLSCEFGTLSGIVRVHAFYDKQFFAKCKGETKTIFDHLMNTHTRYLAL